MPEKKRKRRLGRPPVHGKDQEQRFLVVYATEEEFNQMLTLTTKERAQVLLAAVARAHGRLAD